MLRKIFKYEWKTILPLMLGIHGVGLAVAIFCRIGIDLMGGVDRPDASIMAIMLLLAAIMAIGCVVFYTYFYGGYRFYKTVFTQQGYLTNTLPVTADLLIWGKGLTAVIWIVIDFLWAIVAICILVLSPKDAAEVLRGLPHAVASLFHNKMPLFTWLLVTTTLITPFCMVIQVYVAAAIGNLFTGHKLLATIGSFIGIDFIQQVLALIIMAITAPHIANLSYQVRKMTDTTYVQVMATDIITSAIGLSLAFSVICTVGFYFLCRYVLEHKLNLE